MLADVRTKSLGLGSLGPGVQELLDEQDQLGVQEDLVQRPGPAVRVHEVRHARSLSALRSAAMQTETEKIDAEAWALFLSWLVAARERDAPPWASACEEHARAAGRASAWALLTDEDRAFWRTIARGVLQRHQASIGGPSDPDPPA
jgi:hypothetical protein